MLWKVAFIFRGVFMSAMMIRLLSVIGLVVAAIVGADLSAAADTKVASSEKASPTISEKTMDEVEQVLGKSIIIDARGNGKKKIKGAIFIAADADDKKIKKTLKDKNAAIIVYCGNVKCPASMTLAERLVGLGYTNIGHYAGGIEEWTENNKPVDEHE